MANCETCIKADVCRLYIHKSTSPCTRYIDKARVMNAANTTNEYVSTKETLGESHIPDLYIHSGPKYACN